jgi:hypothetical protein
MRAKDVLTVMAENWWPTQELQARVGYLRAEVPRRAAEEKWLLFPVRDGAPGFTRLGRDHARLRAAAGVLARAASDEGIRPDRWRVVATKRVGDWS